MFLHNLRLGCRNKPTCAISCAHFHIARSILATRSNWLALHFNVRSLALAPFSHFARYRSRSILLLARSENSRKFSSFHTSKGCSLEINRSRGPFLDHFTLSRSEISLIARFPRSLEASRARSYVRARSCARYFSLSFEI
jgi:hypothetical protein